MSMTPSQPTGTNSTLVSGFLFDANMNRVLNQAPIGLSDGQQLVTTRTAQDGTFSLSLPHDGVWILAPHPEYSTFYAFAPIFLTTTGPQVDLGQIDVRGDNAANAQMMETYVNNVMASCQNLFAEHMAKYDPLKLTEEDVALETASIFNILSASLDLIVHSVAASPVSASSVISGVIQPLTAISCTTCRSRYSGNPAALQNCLCCPTPCTPP